MTSTESKPEEAWHRHPPLRLDPADGALDVLDQTVLPWEVRRRRIASVAECCEAIHAMWVRGAPLIGLVAAGGIALAARVDPSDAALERAALELQNSRPTAINLRWAVERVLAALREIEPGARAAQAWALCAAIQREEQDCCERIGAHGLALIERGAALERARARGRVQVLTHCNAGWLATGAWGTALAPLYRAHRSGIALHVWVDETRPRNQGARLTAWELEQAGIPHTVIADSAAAHLMQRGEVDLCLVGSDRTTAHGDVCNKIGTYAKALAAADNAVPFYVAMPVSTVDWDITDGVREIPIEARAEREVVQVEGIDENGKQRSVRTTPAESRALNPAFDVTPARLVTALLFEHGIFSATPQGLAGLRAVAGTPPARV